VLVKADCLTDQQIREAHFEPVGDISAAVEKAGPAASVCVLPHGPQTIPYL
jgi:hypothetical protein